MREQPNVALLRQPAKLTETKTEMVYSDEKSSTPVLLAAIKVTVDKLSRDFDKHETDCEKRGDVLTEVVRRLDRLEQDGSRNVRDIEGSHHRIEAVNARVDTTNARVALAEATDAKRIGFAEGSVKTFAAIAAILTFAVSITYGAIEIIHGLATAHP